MQGPRDPWSALGVPVGLLMCDSLSFTHCVNAAEHVSCARAAGQTATSISAAARM